MWKMPDCYNLTEREMNDKDAEVTKWQKNVLRLICWH